MSSVAPSLLVPGPGPGPVLVRRHPLSSRCPRLSSINIDMNIDIDFALVCAVLAMSEAARGIVMPILSTEVTTLGGDSLFLSVLVSVFSLGRLLASFSFGFLSDRAWSTKRQLQIALAMCVTGNALFIMADAIGQNNTSFALAVLLVARLSTGFGTGVLTVARSHVAATTEIEDRTKFMSYLGIVQFMGFSFTPSLGGLPVSFGPVSPLTFGSYFVLIFDVVLIYLVHRYMKQTEPSNTTPSTAAPALTLSLSLPQAAPSALPTSSSPANRMQRTSLKDAKYRRSSESLFMMSADADADTEQGKSFSCPQSVRSLESSSLSSTQASDRRLSIILDIAHASPLKNQSPSQLVLSSSSSSSPTTEFDERRSSVILLPASPSTKPRSSSLARTSPHDSPSSFRSSPFVPAFRRLVVNAPHISPLMRTRLSRRISGELSLYRADGEPISPDSTAATAAAAEAAAAADRVRRESVIALSSSPFLGDDFVQLQAHDFDDDISVTDNENSDQEQEQEQDEDTTSQQLEAIEEIEENEWQDKEENSTNLAQIDQKEENDSPSAANATAAITQRASVVTLTASALSAVLPPVNPVFPLLYVFLNLCCRGTLGVAETYSAVLFFSVFDSSNTALAGVVITLFGAAGIALFAAIPKINRYVRDVQLLRLGTAAIILGFILMMQFQQPNIDAFRYVAANLCVWSIGAPFCQTFTVSMMSKYLGKRPQGKWMGLITAGGSIGRILFPLLSGACLSIPGLGGLDGAWLFSAIISLMSIIALGAVLTVYQAVIDRRLERTMIANDNANTTTTTRSAERS